MTIAALVLAFVACAALLAERRLNRIERRWQDERERLEAYGEHIAAANGRPHGGVLVYPADDDDAA